LVLALLVPSIAAFRAAGQDVLSSTAADAQKVRILYFAGLVDDLALFPDGLRVAVAAGDESGIYTLDQRLVARLKRPGADTTGSPSSVAFGPEGLSVVTGAWDGALTLWTVRGQYVRELAGHADSVRSIAISPDGRTMVSGSSDRSVRIWSRVGSLIRELTGPRDGVLAVAVSPDCAKVACSSRDGSVWVWSTAGELLGRYVAAQEWTNRLAFSPDGSYLAFGGEGNTVGLVELACGRSRVLDGHSAPVRGVAFSPDGRYLASGAADGVVRLWGPDGELLREVVRPGGSGGVESIAWRRDSETLVVGERAVR
jgi:WD40 repeat protein